jgi:hypothetical protein
MKLSGFISDRMVYATSPFIVYSHTKGTLAEAASLEEAQRAWAHEASCCSERGHVSDALVFQWLQGQWLLCGDLYDLECAAPGRRHMSSF